MKDNSQEKPENFLRRMGFAVQRAMANQSKYIGGYMAKVTKIGKKARQLAKTCLASLTARLHGKSEQQQTMNVVHRCIGDWEANFKEYLKQSLKK